MNVAFVIKVVPRGIFFEGRLFFLYPYGTIFNEYPRTRHVPTFIHTRDIAGTKIRRRNMKFFVK